MKPKGKCRNATRMTQHLVSRCAKCPEVVKSTFRKVQVPLEDVTNITGSCTSIQNENLLCYGNTGKADDNTETIHNILARAIFVTGQPLALVEHPLWKEVFKVLNPDYNPPSRKLLSSSLLNYEYTKVKEEIENKIEEANILHLAADGWTNINNEAIINVIIYTPTPYFYKYIEVKNNRHTGEYIYEQLSKIIEKIGSHKFLIVITDNAANMIKCGKMIENKYKNIRWTGCLAHSLHLIIGDIFKFDIVKQLMLEIVEIIKCIRNSHLLSAELKQISQEKSITKSLHMPVKTRWGSYLLCLDSFVTCKLALQNMAINLNESTFAKFKNRLLDETMWSDLKRLKDFIEPIVNWIVKLEGDYCSIHLVHAAFLELDTSLNNTSGKEILSETNHQKLIEKFQERKMTSLKPIHYAATILDPKNRGISLSTEENLEGCEFIMHLGEEHGQRNIETFLRELSDFKFSKGLWAKEFIWEMAKKVSPVAWWQSLFLKTDLGVLAIKILTAPSTSATVERSFSNFSNIHSKRRNRLQTDKAGKICFISYNWNIMNKDQNENPNFETPSISKTNDIDFYDNYNVNSNISNEYESESEILMDIDIEPEDADADIDYFRNELFEAI